MRLRALLDTPELGLRLLGGVEELDRTVRGVMTTDLRDPSRYLSGGELVLTGLAWHRTAEDSEPFVRILAAAGVAALAAGEAELGAVPEDLTIACARHRLPLFAVVEDVAFATITEHVVRQVSTERAGDLAAVVERHRRLMSSGPGGGGLDAVLDLLVSDLDLRAWVLSPTGRLMAGSGGGAQRLPETVRTRLAGAHLAAVRAGQRSPYRVTGGDGADYALFPVRTGAADARAAVLSDWLLAVRADPADWPGERLDLLEGVTQLIAAEREHGDSSLTMRRRLAQEVLELVQSGAPPAETAARLRAAGQVLVPELQPGAMPCWQVVVAQVEWEEPGEGASGDGSATQSLLEEILAGQILPAPEAQASDADAVDAPDAAYRIAVAHAADEAVALVPLPPTGGGGMGGAGDRAARDSTELDAAELVASIREPLERGLAQDGRLSVGVSAAVHSAEGLRGALEEARHARRVAAAHSGRVRAAGHAELASHVLLLPFVPDDVRRAFTARLLQPLRDYDQRHRAELLPTLEAFLASDGSWTRCASRLHLHVNTLRYRMGRIEQLTGRDLSRLEDKLDFFLALRMS
ncbi:PucR family transcriptional regulator ligand-binding domain-containing protein [Streptomyces sp. N2-109]|uniref:PucR family transcriptional regulator ligand-binding domain-containing protein n=1 Tax=Streptomyces gossypii TaxID=2883101 RepID=A0ABT2K1U6_9ACTN|nr:PucR family transcriptional regulator [Streptomyces gossypii]MCT2594148.1 PucR family transcriptional regulator ligand-binding domain-containing protein [Streptomyces gossypii]